MFTLMGEKKCFNPKMFTCVLTQENGLRKITTKVFVERYDNMIGKEAFQNAQ